MNAKRAEHKRVFHKKILLYYFTGPYVKRKEKNLRAEKTVRQKAKKEIREWAK